MNQTLHSVIINQCTSGITWVEFLLIYTSVNENRTRPKGSNLVESISSGLYESGLGTFQQHYFSSKKCWFLKTKICHEDVLVLTTFLLGRFLSSRIEFLNRCKERERDPRMTSSPWGIWATQVWMLALNQAEPWLWSRFPTPLGECPTHQAIGHSGLGALSISHCFFSEHFERSHFRSNAEWKQISKPQHSQHGTFVFQPSLVSTNVTVFYGVIPVQTWSKSVMNHTPELSFALSVLSQKYFKCCTV